MTVWFSGGTWRHLSPGKPFSKHSSSAWRHRVTLRRITTREGGRACRPGLRQVVTRGYADKTRSVRSASRGRGWR